MRRDNPRHQEFVARLGVDYMVQRLVGGVSMIAVFMHAPLIYWDGREALTVLGFIVLGLLGVIFSWSAQRLAEGTADHGVRRAVRRGTRVAWILAGLVPFSLLASIFNPSLKARPFWIFVIALGIAILVAYFRRTKTYWTYVQSVA